jgi:hypothetical protein
MELTDKIMELTAAETDFFTRFKESTKEVKNVVMDWLAGSKNYEKCTRAQLFAQYKVMEDRIVAILNKKTRRQEDKKTAATAKGGITRNLTTCQKILDYLDEWKESN